MTTPLLPGMAIKPVAQSTIVSCTHRILHVHESSDRIVLIPVEAHRSKDRLYFVSYINTSLTDVRKELDPKDPKLAITEVAARADATATDAELDKKYLRRGQKKSIPRRERERRWALIEPLVTDPDDEVLLFDPQVRIEKIALRAAELSNGPEEHRRLRIEIRDCLNQYWAGGSMRGALTPYRAACGARGKEKAQRNKLGRQNAPTKNGEAGVEGYLLADHDKDIIRFSWRNYYIRGSTIPKACRKMWRNFYSIEVTDDSGKTTTELLPKHQRPTRNQFRDWGAKQSPGHSAWKIQLSKTNAARIDRAITGNANDDIVAVGQRGAVDTTSTDQHFVSTHCRLDRIGLAYRILVVDSAYRYIPGFYMGLHPPSAQTVNLAFLHAMSPKKAWLNFLGLDDQSPDDWIQIVFRSVIADNTDARAQQAFALLDAIGCGQFYIPVARSDLNSDAEVSHHQLHRMVDHNLLGTTRGQMKSERMEARADDLACYTILEGIRETARGVHTHNTMPLDIRPTAEMRRELLDKGLPITRLNLTRMRINQGKVARSLLDIDEGRTHLMPITRGTFTGKGVKLLRPDTGDKRSFVEPIRYVSSHPMMLARFAAAKNEREKHTIDFYDDDFRIDPYNPMEIHFRDCHSGELIRLEARTEDPELLATCSYYDLLDTMQYDAIYLHDVKDARDQALSRMEAGQEEANRAAKDAYDTELAAEPKRPSRTKLRGNKSANREREDAQYQYGMPTPLSPDGPSIDTQNAESEQSTVGPSMDEPIDTAPTNSNPPYQEPVPKPKVKSVSIFATAVRNHLNQEVSHVRQ